jgi:mannose-P-dolichol utilization defect protein 1
MLNAGLRLVKPLMLVSAAFLKEPFTTKMKALIALCLLGSVYALDFSDCMHSFNAGSVTLDCAKLGLSKLLSTLVITLALVSKLPQVLKIWRANSAASVSESSLYTECLSMTLTIAFSSYKGLPLSTYGELIVVIAQNFMIVMLCWNFNSTSLLRIGSVCSLYTAFSAALILDLFPVVFWDSSVVLVTALIVVSRVSQISTIFKHKSTGQLSFVTNALMFLGTASRVFTTIVEVNNSMVLLKFLIALSLHGVIMLQFAIYWDNHKRKD